MAYAFYAMLALLLTWGVIAFRTRSLTRRQQELTRIVAERTARSKRKRRLWKLRGGSCTSRRLTIL